MGRSYKVTDISERGIGFAARGRKQFAAGQTVDLNLRFVDGEVLELTGTIVRADRRAAAVRLSSAIPLQRIRAEELYLIRNYPLRRPR
jgi:hypothetical protein